MRLCVAAMTAGILLCSCEEAPAPPATDIGETAAPETGEALPLSQIARILEFQGYTAIAEVESEGEYWEIEAFKDGERYKLNVDPVDGKILDAEAPSYAIPLSEVLAKLGDRGYGPVVELDLETSDDEKRRLVWEIEIYKGGHAVLLSVDTATGEILSED